MASRPPKTRSAKAKSSRPKREAAPTEIVIPPPRQSFEALEADCPAGAEPTPEELRDLEASVQREEARQNLLGLAREYPRTDRPLVKPLTEALKALPGLKPVQARLVAQSLKQLADLAHDLDEIIDRILREKHEPAEVAELVMAFQLVIEQLGSYADVLEDKLYDVFDRAKGLK